MGGLVAAVVAVMLLAAACGGDDDNDGTTASIDGTTTEPSTTEPSDTSDPDTSDPDTSDPDTSDPDTSDGGDDTTTTTEPDDDDDLPGEEIDLFVTIGDVLGVVGVADDDTLNVRAKPGTDQNVIAELASTADDLVATGRARSLPNSIWYEVSADGVIGWVSSSFVAYLGGTDDATAEFLDGELPPAAETMTDLGRLVAEGFASEDPPSEIVQSEAPSVADLGEVTYDVIGIGDDAVRGYRLRIFAIEDANGETFSLRTIERTTLCGRGLAGELCR